MEFTVSISRLARSHVECFQLCNEIVTHFKEKQNPTLLIDFANCSFIYPDYALLLLCTIKYLESLGHKVGGRITYKNSTGPIEYLAGMKFFDELQVTLPFQYEEAKEDSSLRIQKYTKENQLVVLKDILQILRLKSSMHENVYTSLDYCFNEILDNVLNHSETGEGWIAAQYFPNLNSIRLVVCDFGIGVQKSLNQAHSFTEEEALTKCIEEGITNGKGQGHGLYATAEFIRLNQGWLSIASGTSKLNITEDRNELEPIAHWQGTAVYLRINTNVDVDYAKFTSRNYDYKKQVYEDLFG